MTLLVGIRCRDGVVVASDSAATFGTGLQPTIGQQAVQKVWPINEHIIYCGTGAVGIAQIVADHIKTMWDQKAFAGRMTPDAAMDRIGKAISGLVGPYLHTGQMQHAMTGSASGSLCKSLVAIPIDQKPELFQFDFNGAPERCNHDLPFMAIGSGQPIADPFLALLRRLLWTGREPTLSEGRLAAVWTIDHVRSTNPGGVGGKIQLAVLETSARGMPKVVVAPQEQVEEHLQKVALAEQALVKELTGAGGAEEAAIPVPPPDVETAAAPTPARERPAPIAD